MPAEDKTTKDRNPWLSTVWFIAPFLLVLGLFLAFFFGLFPGVPGDTAVRGQFGDGFGVLNSLFTGLGFAGLLATIQLQQRQMKKQAADFGIQVRSAEIREYEENLYRLLQMYGDALSSVISTKDGQTTRGRDVLRQTTDGILKQLRQERVNSVPHDVQTRYRKNALTEDDKLLLDYLYYRNFWHLNYSLLRQGRLLETLKALLSHLEEAGPPQVDRSTYRNIVCSQITHIEISYFLLVALGTRSEDRLRDLLVRSTLISKAANVYKLQVHKFMYRDYWGYDLSRDKEDRALPIPKARIKALERKQIEIHRMLRAKPPSSPEQSSDASDSAN
jgi:hypothetical protein